MSLFTQRLFFSAQLKTVGASTGRTAFFLGALAVLSLSFACRESTVDLNAAHKTSADPEDYQEVFLKWSRTVKVIPVDGLENILTARATYLSPAFRDVYVERMAADLEMTAAEKEKLRAEETAGAEKGHEFYVTLMSGVEDCDDLTPDEGPWRIRLKDDRGREVEPLSIEEIERPSVSDRKYFDFDPDSRKAYRLVFPKTAADGSPILTGSTRFFELAFAAAFGKHSARWETTHMNDNPE
jgi:hypothetical protein